MPVIRAAVATSMVIVFIIMFPHYLAFREPCGIPKRSVLGLAPRRRPSAVSSAQVVPRRIVPAAQKYSHIRVSISEAVTAAHATTKAVIRFDSFHANRKPGGLVPPGRRPACRLLELFRHAQMFLEMRERRGGPLFQLGILTAF